MLNEIDDRISEIKGRAFAATPGPWVRSGASIERHEIASYLIHPSDKSRGF